MRILMVSQWFNPEPSFKGLTFAKALRARGHEVEVLTGFPNYPGGKLYPDYRQRWLLRETMDGIPVIRVPLYPSHDGSAVRRIGNYASFALSAATIGAASVGAADVMYVYHPPATVALPAILISRIRRIPFVYDVQDLWPDTLAATGMLDHPAALALVGAWCRLTYRAARRVVVLSPGFREALLSRGVPGDKIDVIPNWAEEGPAGPPLARDEELARNLGFAGRFNVVFAGTMGKAQALDAVIEAAVRLKDRAPDVRFVFIGGGVEAGRLEAAARGRGLPNVIFLPRRPASEIGEILALADVLVVHLKRDPLFRITIPSKIQAYLAAGKPILAAVEGDAAELVEQAGAGVACTPEDPESIAAAVEGFSRTAPEALEAMGRRGREFYQRELSLDVAVGRFEETFNAAARKVAT